MQLQWLPLDVIRLEAMSLDSAHSGLDIMKLDNIGSYSLLACKVYVNI